MFKSLTFAVALSVAAFNLAHAGSYRECPVSFRKVSGVEVQGNFTLGVLREIQENYIKLHNTNYRWWNQIRYWYSKNMGGLEYIPIDVEIMTFKMAAASFYEMVGRAEPYITSELELLDPSETPRDMDRHIQTQADRIEYEMHELEASYDETSEAKYGEPPRTPHKSLSEKGEADLIKIRSLGTMADSYRTIGWKRPDER